MIRALLFFIVSIINIAIYSPAGAQNGKVQGWEIFATVNFKAEFFKEQQEYFLVPEFDAKIRSLEGKEVILKGHYLPFSLKEKSTIIISKYPYSMCFFCGGAGPESVAEIELSERPPRLKTDQIIQVKGTLVLNKTDVNHMNFILRNASIYVP